MVFCGMCLQTWMQNIDQLRSYGTQYECMLAEYAEFVSSAHTKLRSDPRVHADGLDGLRQQLSSLLVKHLILLCVCILLQNLTLYLTLCGLTGVRSP